MKTRLTITFVLTILINAANAQKNKYSSFFVGYETMEMAMNKFQNFAGEIGYRFNEKHQIRLMIGEVNLTERHLSSEWESAAVDGNDIEGYFRIYELYFDRYFGKRKEFYYSGSVAYVKDEYNHLISDNSLEHETATIGFAIGFRKENLFGINHLYINASVPFRYYFNEIMEKQWGKSKVNPHTLVNNVWFFVGYTF